MIPNPSAGSVPQQLREMDHSAYSGKLKLYQMLASLDKIGPI